PSAPSTQLIGAMFAPAQIQNWCIAVDTRWESATGSKACAPWAASGGVVSTWLTGPPRGGWGSVLHADVLVPERGIGGDELAHHLDALVEVQHDELHTVLAEQALRGGERTVLADHHAGDPVQQDRARAEMARRQRRIERRLAVHPGGQTSRVLQAVGLPVPDRAALLHPPVAPDAEHLAIRHQRRADRDPALGQADAGLLDRQTHVPVVAHRYVLLVESKPSAKWPW